MTWTGHEILASLPEGEPVPPSGGRPWGRMAAARMREGERRGRLAFGAEDAASDVGAATVVCKEAVACG